MYGIIRMEEFGLDHIVVYRCYSLREHEFLKKHGIEYIIKCRDIKTHVEMWLYERNTELNKLLDEFKALVNN